MRLHLAASLLLTAPWALAQGDFDGRWKASFHALGQDRQADVVIQGQGGTWQTLYLPQGSDICARLKVPIEVLERTAQSITIVARRAQALAGCTDGQATQLNRVDDKTLQGNLANGATITLTR
jgi:glucose/arabinose dehydrogenase